MRNILLLISISLLISCGHGRKALLGNGYNPSISSLKLLGQYEVPFNQPYKGTTIGGLSSIDYDAIKQQYYFISDDRSAINPARFYTAKISSSQKGIDSVSFTNVTTFLAPDGQPYPNSKTNPTLTPDPESIRYNAATNQFVWTSEGERKLNKKDTILENPAITIIEPNGKYIDTFPIPAIMQMHASENGPRQNGVFEGCSFTNHFKTLFVNVEEPIYEDGPRAMLQDTSAWIRILKYEVDSKINIAQFAYRLEPIAHPSVPENDFKINGIPEILALRNDKLLVMERSFSSGRDGCSIKVFLADLANAENIKNNTSLAATPPKKPVVKKLLLNFDNLGIYVDNLEGLTFGPDLPNGHKTLLFVSDNNFEPKQKTQIFLFEVMP